jgi:hypothetical protein
MAHVYTRTQVIKRVVRAVETVVNRADIQLVQGSIHIMVGRLFSILSLSDDVNPAIVETPKTLGAPYHNCFETHAKDGLFTFPHSSRCLALCIYICVCYPCLSGAVRLLPSAIFPPNQLHFVVMRIPHMPQPALYIL